MTPESIEQMRRQLYVDVFKIMLERGESPTGDAPRAATHAVKCFDEEFAEKREGKR